MECIVCSRQETSEQQRCDLAEVLKRRLQVLLISCWFSCYRVSGFGPLLRRTLRICLLHPVLVLYLNELPFSLVCYCSQGDPSEHHLRELDEQMKGRLKVSFLLQRAAQTAKNAALQAEDEFAAAERAYEGYRQWLGTKIRKNNGDQIERRQNNIAFREGLEAELEYKYTRPRRVLAEAIRNAKSADELADCQLALELFGADPNNHWLSWPDYKKESYARVLKTLQQEQVLEAQMGVAKLSMAQARAEADRLQQRATEAAARVRSTREERRAALQPARIRESNGLTSPQKRRIAQNRAQALERKRARLEQGSTACA